MLLENIPILYSLDLIGTLVFAISGTLTAMDKRFDIFGAFVIAFITAVGGGTIRDILIGSQPVGWMQDLNYLAAIVLGVLLAYFMQRLIQYLRRTFFLFDTIGIGIFTVLGLQKTLTFGISPEIAILMGTVSAVFGGVLRDNLSNEIPLIFRKEVYATACLAGGILYVLLMKIGIPEQINTVVTILFIISIRILAVRFHWSLPVIQRRLK
ncbi:MAG: membrane protein [Saprospiraceae bacterium]|nr:MAG: membrane protein [Saprospiraceae bacterium]